MKNKLILIATLVSSLMFSSCDNFLDIKPVGSVIPETLDEYRALIAKSYKTVSDNTHDRFLAGYRADEMDISPTDSWTFDGYGHILIWTDSPTNGGAREYAWKSYYEIIFIANDIIENKNKIKNGTKETVDQIVGEAYMLRAYMHFNLVNLFGQPYTKPGALESKAIPLKLDNDLEKVMGRSTISEIYKSIQEDLVQAKSLINVSKWDTEFSYRFTTNSVDAFQARLALYMGEWQEAYDRAEDVLTANASLEDLNEATPVIPNFYTSVEVITALEKMDSNVSSDLIVPPSFMSKYSAEDKRVEVYFSAPNADGHIKSQKGGLNTFSCSFRTAEAYLTSAEAAAMLDKLPESRKRLLELMEKRYSPTGYTAKKALVDVMNKDQLVTEILEERARELALEGHRWFDLRRTTRPQIVKTVKGETHTLAQDDPRYTIKIPRNAIEANPGLNN